jgi:hypothetical protein
MGHADNETLICVDWCNNRKLLEPIGDVSPAESKERSYEKEKASVETAGLR